MESLISANRAVALGANNLAITGGVESMSRAPWVLLTPAKGFSAEPETVHSTTLGWRMTNPRMPGDWPAALGEATERLAENDGITRDAQDAFALASHQKAAWDAGVYADEVIGLAGVDLDCDESIRGESTFEELDRFGPVEAAETAVRRGGIGWDELALVDANEAFAAQSLACIAEWVDLDPTMMNLHGRAIAIGHPLGCSDARVVGQGLDVVLEGL